MQAEGDSSMTILSDDRSLTDRIALSHELLELSGRFEAEAANWQHPAMSVTRNLLESSATVLAYVGRLMIHGGDERVGEAYRDAAIDQLKNIMGKRRRLEQIRAYRLLGDYIARPTPWPTTERLGHIDGEQDR
jgi:hypothetical protein